MSDLFFGLFKHIVTIFDHHGEASDIVTAAQVRLTTQVLLSEPHLLVYDGITASQHCILLEVYCGVEAGVFLITVLKMNHTLR